MTDVDTQPTPPRNPAWQAILDAPVGPSSRAMLDAITVWGDACMATERALIKPAAEAMVRMYEQTTNCHTVAGGRKYNCSRCLAADALADAVGIDRQDVTS